MNRKTNLTIFLTGLALIGGFTVYQANKLGEEARKLGATVTTIQSSDLISDSRSTINTNFSNLNSSKLEIGTDQVTVGSLIATTTASSTFAGKLTSFGKWFSLGSGTATSTLYSTSSLAITEPSGSLLTFTSWAGNVLVASTTSLFIDSFGRVMYGTTSPTSLFHITNPPLGLGAVATTTSTFGSATTTSRTCFNLRSASGTQTSFYVGTAGTIVVELNACR